MSRRNGILGDGTLETLPSVETFPTLGPSLPSVLERVTAGASTTALPGLPPGEPAVPMAKLERGELRLLLAPASSQLPWGVADGKTLAVQRHVNYWLRHYGHQAVPEDGVMSPLLCAALELLDVGLPVEYERVHGNRLAELGWLGRDGGAGYISLFTMAGTPGRHLVDGCAEAAKAAPPAPASGALPAFFVSDLTGAARESALRGLPPPPASSAPSLAPLVVAAGQEVRSQPRLDSSQPALDTGWPATLSLPAGTPLPPKTAPAPGPAPVPAPPVPPGPAPGPTPAPKPAPPPPPATTMGAAGNFLPVLLVGLGAAALGAVLLGGKKGRRR